MSDKRPFWKSAWFGALIGFIVGVGVGGAGSQQGSTATANPAPVRSGSGTPVAEPADQAPDAVFAAEVKGKREAAGICTMSLEVTSMPKRKFIGVTVFALDAGGQVLDSAIEIGDSMNVGYLFDAMFGQASCSDVASLRFQTQ